MGLQITVQSDEFTSEPQSDMVVLGLWSADHKARSPVLGIWGT